MSQKKWNILSRSSALALKQVDEVMQYLPNEMYEIISVQSYGDKNKDISLLTNDEPDFFTRELDEALLDGKGDFAVHSAKDLPWPLPEGLEIIAITKAADKSDALVSKNLIKLNDLPENARVGTSSVTRKEELLNIRKDLQIISIRGTIEERLSLVKKGEIDALIVATCALKRLGLDHEIAEILSFRTHPLQGNLAVVSRKNNEELKRKFSKIDIRNNFGKVYLIGAGSGAYNWMTLEGFEIIKNSDIIFHDDLIDKKVLEHSTAEKIFVGKRKGNHFKNQGEIHELMYHEAMKGKTIVRLKGGDPMIFAHGGEEIKYLQEKLVEVEVVPGITSAIGAAAIGQIPLTLRNISSSVAFCSGHSLDSLHIPNTDTIVYYMCAATIKGISKKLMASGRKPDTPVALVYNIGNEDQNVTRRTLTELLRYNDYKAPLLAIIGEVSDKRSWHKMEKKKLDILFTGTHPEKYKHLGHIVHYPMIYIAPLSDYKLVDKALISMSNFDWLIFTSKYAVNYFFKRLHFLKKDSRYLSGKKVASIGKYTSEALLDHGICPDLQPEDESSEGLINEFVDKKIKDKKILIPRSNLALSKLPSGLNESGNQVTVLEIYQNKMPELPIVPNLNDFKKLIFTSPSGINNFFSMYDQVPKNIQILVKGKESLKALHNQGYQGSIIDEPG